MDLKRIKERIQKMRDRKDPLHLRASAPLRETNKQEGK